MIVTPFYPDPFYRGLSIQAADMSSVANDVERCAQFLDEQFPVRRDDCRATNC
jgi:hypothetical protein